MEEIKYEYKSLDDENLLKFMLKISKYYNNTIRQKIKYKGKRVSFGSHRVTLNKLFFDKQFVHISSFSDADSRFYKPLPCQNEGYNEFCYNCIEQIKTANLDGKTRAICIYRMSKLPLIKYIFKKINIGELNNITIYEEETFVNKKCKKENFVHIRYIDENIYYYIKLQEVIDIKRGNYYSFYCAFPVFNSGKKRELDKMFGKVKRN